MKRFYVEKQNIHENYATIDGGEFLHLTNVLRLKTNDKVCLFCDDEFDYICEIKELNKKQAQLAVIEKIINTANPKTKVDVFQALPKSDKLELITQKLTELGVSNIYPFESQFTIAKKNDGKIERMNKISIEACKQCGRSKPLCVNNVISFSCAIDMLKNYDAVIFAYEKATCKLSDIALKGSVAIVVGSEGGFSENEIMCLEKSGYHSISLGTRILRTETASIVLAGYVMLSLGDRI